MHYHMVVQTATACRWLEIAHHLRQASRVYASVSSVSARKSYWAALGYLYAPNGKKNAEDIDKDPVFSEGHEEVPLQLQQRRQGIRRLQPTEIFETIKKFALDTVLKFCAFASRMWGQGDRSWVQLVMTKGEAKIREYTRSAQMLLTAASQLQFAAMSHLQILLAALNHECICGGRAVPAWEQILCLNHIDVDAYCASLYCMFEAGGGKGNNHLYIGAPNSGKTALTRAPLSLFGGTAFVKPQVGTTFILAGLIGAKVLVWNDFRWPHPPLAWGDLLNMLDNEGFGVGVPKGDGAQDYQWNAKGDESIIGWLTTNVPIVYISGNSINQAETNAFNERFGDTGVYYFTAALPKPDKRYKVWLRCTRCYAEWVTRRGRPQAATGHAAFSPSRSSSSAAGQQVPRTRSPRRPNATAGSLPPAVPAFPSLA